MDAAEACLEARGFIWSFDKCFQEATISYNFHSLKLGYPPAFENFIFSEIFFPICIPTFL